MVASLFGLMVAGCDSGSSSSAAAAPAPAAPAVVPAVPANVALQANGGVATATYDNAGAVRVNNGDTTTSDFWAGNIQNDLITVAFDGSYDLTEIKIHTSAANNFDTKLQISSDGVTFTDVSYYGGAGDCESLVISNSSDTVTCGFFPERAASHVRVVILNATPVTVPIYEIEATGT